MWDVCISAVFSHFRHFFSWCKQSATLSSVEEFVLLSKPKLLSCHCLFFITSTYGVALIIALMLNLIEWSIFNRSTTGTHWSSAWMRMECRIYIKRVLDATDLLCRWEAVCWYCDQLFNGFTVMGTFVAELKRSKLGCTSLVCCWHKAQLCGVNENVSSCGRGRSLALLLARISDLPSIIKVSSHDVWDCFFLHSRYKKSVRYTSPNGLEVLQNKLCNNPIRVL